MNAMLDRSLLEVERLLTKYGCAQVHQVTEARRLIASAGASALATLVTTEWWGGAGSIADVYLHREGEPGSGEQDDDNRALRAALIDIYEAMEAGGFTSERAARWTDTFKKWRRNGF